MGSEERLSDIERRHFRWDHAQAGAWIVKTWNFSEEMICYIGAHNLAFDKIKECELDDTIVLPVAMSSVAPSILNPDSVRMETFVDTERFFGTCYKASNWRYLGQTTGRGKNDQTHQQNRSLKAVWGYPLVKNFKELLRR